MMMNTQKSRFFVSFGFFMAVLIFASAAPAPVVIADEKDETRSARVGELIILRLPGNREGGFRWRLDKTKSKGLENVEVKPIGWTIQPDNGGSLFFRRELPIMSMSVLPKAAGQAEIAFEYYRLWNTRPNFQPRTKYVRVTIKPR